jgi:negative regulator of flagellin synthesis FlgM
MTSKIDSLNAAGIRAPEPVTTRVASAKTGNAAPVASTDSVALTADARNLAAAHRSALEEPSTIDHAKVASLRAAIEGGTYKVDPQAIAARLIDVERALR